MNQPRRLLDENGQSPAAVLLRAARADGPPPPEGAKERAMAALGRAAAESTETAPQASRPRRWSRIAGAIAIAAAAIVPLWLWLRPPPEGLDGAGVTGPHTPEPLILRQPKLPRSDVEPLVLVWLDCGDARRLVMPEEIAYTRDDIEAGAESDMLVSCEMSEDGAFKSCRVIQKPAKIDAAKVLQAVGTWRYSRPPSEMHLLPSSCLVRFQFMRPTADSFGTQEP